MPRRLAVRSLVLMVLAGCATVSESDGRLDDLDAATNDLGAFKDESVLRDDSSVDAADSMPDPPDGRASIDAPVDAPADRPDAGSADRADVVDLGPGVECVEPSTRPCYTGLASTRGVGLCADGFQRCSGGRWASACNGETRPQVETCNGIDDDCDTAVDNIAPMSCYTGPAGTVNVGICRAGTYRCDGTVRVCGQVAPQTERCGNGMDDNCNGVTDEMPCIP